jgi:hypothetical protein
MRTRTEDEVRRWLRTHRDKAAKLLEEIGMSDNGIETRSDTALPKEELLGEQSFFILLQSILAKDTTFNKKLDSFCAKITEHFGVEKCAIFLLNRGTNTLQVLADKKWGPYVSVNMSQGIIGKSAFLNKILFMKDPSAGAVYTLTT